MLFRENKKWNRWALWGWNQKRNQTLEKEYFVDDACAKFSSNTWYALPKLDIAIKV